MAELILAAGSLIGGRYRLERHLGEGGMGSVWSATHVVTRRAVAMKFLKPALQSMPELRQRFLREASAASALRHAHVVDVLDVFDVENETPVLVMELLEGETLGAKLARDERLSVEETASLILPVASAVESAHALGIVHRDLKPENIFLARGENGPHVKVLDFGIAKLTAEHCLEHASPLVTEAGSLLGTPCYMAPEQVRGRNVDHRADLWSLGVILYECLSGMRPIEGDNPVEVVARLMTEGITPLDRLAPELPAEITAAVQQLLMRDPDRRPRDLSGLCAMLERHTLVRAPKIALPRTSSAVSTSEQPEPSPRLELIGTLPSAATVIAEGPPRPPTRRRIPAVSLGLALVAASAIAAAVHVLRTPAAATPVVRSGAAPAAAAQTRLQRSLESLPTAQAYSAEIPAITADAASAPRVSVQGVAPRARRRGAPLGARTEPAVQGRALDEEALFSGRK